MKNKLRVGIIGTGAYGLALAKLAHANNHQVMAWTKFEEEKNEIETTRQNKKVLENVIIEEEIKITTNLKELIQNNDLIVIAIPLAFVTETLQTIPSDLSNKYFCIASKGIEQKTHLFLHEIFKKYIASDNYAVISGPSFAIDIINQYPISLSIATSNDETYNIVSKAFTSWHFNFQKVLDIVGIEVCGAIKNVIAIASGMVKGLELSDSTQALFITKTLKDIQKLLEILGGQKETLLSLAGFGDLLLTCTSTKSRNYSFGYLLAKNKEEAHDYQKTHTIEGVYTLKSIYTLLEEKGEVVPIVSLLMEIVFNNQDAQTIIEYLMQK